MTLNKNGESDPSIRLSSAQKDSLDVFLKEPFKTHDPNEEIAVSCLGR
jgi:hypothetical protein